MTGWLTLGLVASHLILSPTAAAAAALLFLVRSAERSRRERESNSAKAGTSNCAKGTKTAPLLDSPEVAALKGAIDNITG